MIPIFNLTRQYKTIRKPLTVAFRQLFATGMFTLGNQVTQFENEMKQFLGTPYAVGVASGTDALTLALRALDVSNDDEVVLPANSYPTVFGVAMSGARIVLVDCDANGLMDLEKLKKVVTKKTKAVIPVHLYGHICNIKLLSEILHDYCPQAVIIEDCAQAIGGISDDGKKVGSIGEIGCFSFYPSKNLGGYGDGGMITTKSESISRRVQQLRMYGEKERYKSVEVSGISRLDELQAAVLRVKLTYLADWQKKRAAIANTYSQALVGVGDIRPISPVNARNSVWHLYVIQTGKRNELQNYLSKQGIVSAIHYPLCIHQTESFRYLGYNQGDFPVSESLSREVLSLPLFPELTNTEISRVIRSVTKFFQSHV